MSGTVTFRPLVSSVKVTDTEPVTVSLAPITANLDAEGYLSRNGQRGVRLLATDGPTNPTGFTYQVQFSLSLGQGQMTFPHNEFSISVPAGQSTDLTLAAPVASSGGTAMVRGVGVQDVTVENGEFIFHLTDGTESRAPVPPVEGEAAVSVGMPEEGHYTVNGTSIMGLTSTGGLPATAANEVQSIASSAVMSSMEPMQAAVDGARTSADTAAALADAATTRVGELETTVGRTPWINVKSFGAAGNNTGDDTVAINNAIKALPAAGGTVYFPAGTYKITDNIISRNALTLVGEGSSATVIYQATSGKHGLLCTDQLYLTVRGLALVGTGAGNSIGINLNRVNGNASNYIRLDDVRLRTWGWDGIAGSNVIVSSWNNVIAEKNTRHGFNIYNSNGVSTSLSMNSCYANQNGQRGFSIAGTTYSSLTGCAAEKNGTNDYHLVNCQGLILNGCGTESNGLNATTAATNKSQALYISGGESISVTGWMYNRLGAGVKVTGNAKGVKLLVAETDGAEKATQTSTVALSVDAGCTYDDSGSQWKGTVQIQGTPFGAPAAIAAATALDSRVTTLENRPAGTGTTASAPVYLGGGLYSYGA